MPDEDLHADQQSLVNKLLAGDELALSRIITHLENREPAYRNIAEALMKHTGCARIVGITGPPGAGKSTLVDQLVKQYRHRGETVGAIAIDPASPYTGGSILGDRIRQNSLIDDQGVFFRSMSARNRSGGLSAATFDAIRALDAFGKDVIIVETVGTGQSEVEVVKAADTVCVVLLPGAGDDIQANKAGILEIADAFAVNKADLRGAGDLVLRLREMLELGSWVGWEPPIVETVAKDGTGVKELVVALDEHMDYLRHNGRLKSRRESRFEQEATLHARERFLSRLETVANEVKIDHTDGSPHEAASRLLENI